MLIDTYGASINAANRRGYTSLHLAAAAGYADMVELLLSYHDCEFDTTNASGVEPAAAAKYAGHTAIMEYLNSITARDSELSFWLAF